MKGRALFERNAAACENAKTPVCRCACGGALHGSKHSAEWIRETWSALSSVERAALELAAREAARVEQGALL